MKRESYDNLTNELQKLHFNTRMMKKYRPYSLLGDQKISSEAFKNKGSNDSGIMTEATGPASLTALGFGVSVPSHSTPGLDASNYYRADEWRIQIKGRQIDSSKHRKKHSY